MDIQTSAIARSARASRMPAHLGHLALKAVVTLLAFGSVSLTVLSHAAPPYQPDLVMGGNKWSFRAFDDSDPLHKRLADAQGVCFEYAGTTGNHQKYTWYSDTFPGWRGTAVQLGDEILMHGDYAANAGHSAMHLDFVLGAPSFSGRGFWTEWREDQLHGNTVGYATTRAARAGNCTLTAKEAAALPPRLDGNPMVTNIP